MMAISDDGEGSSIGAPIGGGSTQGNRISKQREEFEEILLIPRGFFELCAERGLAAPLALPARSYVR